MKKISIIVAALLIAAFLCACTAVSTDAPGQSGTLPPEGSASSQSPAVTPAPTPTPEGVEAVFGKKIKLVALSSGDEAASELFFAGVKHEAEALGIEVETAACGENFDKAAAQYEQGGADAVIAYLPKPLVSYATLESLAAKGIPVSIFELIKGSAPATVSYTYYNSAGEVAMALDALISYPPHSTPVRQISLFQNKKTPAYTAYSKYVSGGKIFPKELYIAASDKKKSAKSWYTGKLSGYYAGMLDAVFAENEALAIAALDALEAKKRNDMEIFCTAVTSEIVKRMEANPNVFVQAVGPNVFYAGVLNMRIAAGMLKGANPVTEEFLPCAVNAAELAKSDPPTVFASLAGDKADKYNEPWMDTLREIYAKK